MKTQLFILMVILVLVFSACSGGSSTSSSENITTNKDVNYTALYEPQQDQILTVEGNGNDLVTFTFEKNSIDLDADNIDGVELHFTLKYNEDGELSGFEVAESMEFINPVIVTLDASALKNDDKFLVYVNGNEVTPLPFIKEDEKYIYRLEHFSEYRLDPAPDGDADNYAQTIIDKFEELESIPDKSGGIVPIESDLSTILNLLAHLELQGDSRYEMLSERLSDLLESYVLAFINAEPNYNTSINGYCLSDDFKSYIKELLKNIAILEVYTDNTQTTQDAGWQKIEDLIGNTVDAFILFIDIEQECDDLDKYLECGINLAAYAELYGPEGSSENLIEAIEQKFNDRVDAIIAQQVESDKSNCDEILACLNIALDTATKWGMDSAESKLQTRIDSVEDECKLSECPYAWDVTVYMNTQYTDPGSSYYGSDWTNSVTFKDILITTNEDEQLAADIQQCDGMKNIYDTLGGSSIYSDDGFSTFDYIGSFDPNGEAGSFDVGAFVVENEEESLAESAIVYSILTQIQARKTFTASFNGTPDATSGTVNGTFTFLPHMPK